MPRKPTAKQLYDELLNRYGREVADGFQRSIEALRSGADLQRALAAIEAGDADALIAALHIDPAAYGPLLEAIRSAYVAGGDATTTLFPSRDGQNRALVIRFDARNVSAEGWLRGHSADLVTRIVDDQKAAIRKTLTAGLERGQNPRNTALDIVGRLDRATGKRQGGVIGLTEQQAEFVANAREELSSADPAVLRNYLGRAARDKRFDRSVEKAIREGTALPADIQRKAALQYENRLLKIRGDLIGQHETFTALASSRHEAYAQAIASGKLTADQVTKRWKHLPSLHPRADHIAMNGKVVRFDQPFILPDGTPMMYPHDPSAPVRHTAGCKCQCDYSISFLHGIR